MSWILMTFMLLLVLAGFLPLGVSLLYTWLTAQATEAPAAE